MGQLTLDQVRHVEDPNDQADTHARRQEPPEASLLGTAHALDPGGKADERRKHQDDRAVVLAQGVYGVRVETRHEVGTRDRHRGDYEQPQDRVAGERSPTLRAMDGPVPLRAHDPSIGVLPRDP